MIYSSLESSLGIASTMSWPCRPDRVCCGALTEGFDSNRNEGIKYKAKLLAFSWSEGLVYSVYLVLHMGLLGAREGERVKIAMDFSCICWYYWHSTPRPRAGLQGACVGEGVKVATEFSYISWQKKNIYIIDNFPLYPRVHVWVIGRQSSGVTLNLKPKKRTLWKWTVFIFKQ